MLALHVVWGWIPAQGGGGSRSIRTPCGDCAASWDATSISPGGGTAVAIYLHHRVSRDLDFFYHDDSLDLGALERELKSIGAAVTLRAPGTLRVQIGEAKVEFLHADEKAPQHQIEKPKEVSGVPLASLRDIMAMKLKVLAESGGSATITT